MAKRNLHIYFWDDRCYISTNKQELDRFRKFYGLPEVIRKRPPGKTNWNIPTVERAPKWVPVPVIPPGRIEYGRRKEVAHG